MKNKEKKVILIRGTGTVGYEFIKRLVRAVRYCDHPYFKWDEIIFSKQSPLVKNIPKMRNLFRDAGNIVNLNMCVDEQRVNRFKEIGLNPAYTTEQALRKADVIFDVTSAGGENKSLYEKFAYDKEKVFIAEGSEFNKKRKFGSIFIGGVNEEPVLEQLRSGNQFFVVGSCNAHTIARNIQILMSAFNPIISMDQVLILATLCRRSDDPNKEKVNTAFSFSSFNEEYSNEGSYHAYNVLEAFKSANCRNLNLKTVVAKLADPFMHCVFWRIIMPQFSVSMAKKLFLDSVEKDIFCATTHYHQANEVFMESREDSDPEFSPWLGKSKSYSHTVICLPTVGLREISSYIFLEYGSFTPQDSNTIWSNLEMACMAKNPHEFDKKEFLKITAPLFEPKEI